MDTPELNDVEGLLKIANRWASMTDKTGASIDLAHCRLIGNGIIALLTRLQAAEARALKPNRDAMVNRSEADWQALEDAIGTLWGLKPGHVLTEDDVAGLRLMDTCHREDEEAATDAYNSGLEHGLRERGGDELVALHAAADKARIDKVTEHTMRVLAGARADDLRDRLHDLVMLDAEERATGGGPGFKERSERAWANAREIFEP